MSADGVTDNGIPLGGLTMADLFEELKNSIDSLSEAQVEQLLSMLESKKSGTENNNGTTANKPDKTDKKPTVACPNCGGVEVVKIGKKDGRQRYKCKYCNRTFGDTTGKLNQHSKLTAAQWKSILKGVVQNLPLSKIAEEARVSVQTAWYNKQKLCNILDELFSEQDNKFNGIVECDEYIVRLSFKGKRDANFFVNELGRMPKHHRSRSEKEEYLKKNGLWQSLQSNPTRLNELLTAKGTDPGRIYEKASILTCKDRSENLYIRPVCVGRMENEHVAAHLSGKVNRETIMVTDSYAPYKNFAEMERIHIEQILSEKHTNGAFNLAHINALHAKLSAFWPKSAGREPATKYIDLQLMLFWWLEKHREMPTARQVDELYKYLSEPTYESNTLTYDRLIHRPLHLDTKYMIPEYV